MARKRRFRFGFAHRLRRKPVCRRGRPRLSAIRFAAAARLGALGAVWPDSVSPDSKSPRRIFRRGPNSCDDEDMPVICPTCQNVFAGSLKRPDHATLHGVVLDIFVATVLPDQALSENLLGLSFLSKLKRFEYGQRAVGPGAVRRVRRGLGEPTLRLRRPG